MTAQQSSGIGRIALKYGVILGILSFLVFLATVLTGSQQGLPVRVIGLALLVVLMVLAHQEFKKTHGGMMSYSQGLGCGTLLSMWAAVVKCIPTYIYATYINTGFLTAALRMQEETLQRRGITGAPAEQAMAITSAMMTPVGITVATLVAGVIGGCIVALIVSIFTQKGEGASYASRPPG